MRRTTSRRLRRRGGCVVGLVAVLLAIPVAPASAHPLGNFTVNHYNGLKLSPAGVSDLAVIDAAELPTIQERDDVDTDGDRTTSAGERTAFAASQCQTLAGRLVLRVNGSAVPWTVVSSSFTYRAGAAGLDVSRLECSLSANVDLRKASSVSFVDGYLESRIGWREITATGDGVDLGERDVATRSVSDELRSYPNDLLTSPLDQRRVQLRTRPGIDTGSANLPELAQAGPVASFLSSMTKGLDSLVAARDLTIGVGLLALLLSLVLGVSHAALPGHGKTLMAAYMVGTRGSPKDAVLIAATVTLTHTAGVLVLGLLFSASASFAGETVLAVLGVVSGLLVAGIGATLMRSALRRRERGNVEDLWGHRHTSAHTHGHTHSHAHGHGHGHGQGPTAAAVSSSTNTSQHGLPGGAMASTGPILVADPEHDLSLSPDSGPGPGHPEDREHDHVTWPPLEVDEASKSRDQGFRRLTLVGMGLAGGLVPSPSALIVLLGAIGLGRTVFGVALVIGYGLGMAVTLTTVGYLIARLPGRLSRLRRVGRNRWVVRVTTAAPVLTAALVFAVGAGLAARSASPLV